MWRVEVNEIAARVALVSAGLLVLIGLYKKAPLEDTLVFAGVAAAVIVCGGTRVRRR